MSEVKFKVGTCSTIDKDEAYIFEINHGTIFGKYISEGWNTWNWVPGWWTLEGKLIGSDEKKTKNNKTLIPNIGQSFNKRAQLQYYFGLIEDLIK